MAVFLTYLMKYSLQSVMSFQQTFSIIVVPAEEYIYALDTACLDTSKFHKALYNLDD